MMTNDRTPPTSDEPQDIQWDAQELIRRNRLRAVFQPLVDLDSGTVFAHESLVRCDVEPFKRPDLLFEHAVESGHVGQLGRYLRRLAVDGSHPLPLFLNIHPNEFAEGFLVRPDDAMFWHKNEVFIEITESVPLSHFEWCQSVLDEVRRRGVFLAVDDLGAGYSNLKYIADLSPEVVKLDRELTAGVSERPRQLQLVTSLVRLCSEMGAKVVAEGIETIDELQAMRDAGAHFGQGFLLARPAAPPPPTHWPEVMKRESNPE